MFLGAQIVIINKIDLADVMGVSVKALTNDVHALKPDIRVIPTSCKNGTGLDALAQMLLEI
jgi:hydrogenase nickel incorporation protein HypB